MLLSAEEYATVRSKAGLIPLSSWFRNLALCEATGDLVPIKNRRTVVESNKEPAAPFGDPLPPGTEIKSVIEAVMPEAKPRKKLKQCSHGVNAGHHCWRCGGIAAAY